MREIVNFFGALELLLIIHEYDSRVRRFLVLLEFFICFEIVRNPEPIRNTIVPLVDFMQIWLGNLLCWIDKRFFRSERMLRHNDTFLLGLLYISELLRFGLLTLSVIHFMLIHFRAQALRCLGQHWVFGLLLCGNSWFIQYALRAIV